MSNFSELLCVAGEYISPAATSVPALPVEFVPLRGFFLFFYFCQSRPDGGKIFKIKKFAFLT